MPKSNTQSAQTLSQILNNVAPSYGGNVYLSLHTASPGAGGDQTTNEVSYTNYARVAVVRDNSGTGWTTSGTSRTNVGQIIFATCGAGATQTATFLAVGSASSGTGQIHYFGALDSSLDISLNVKPIFDASAITVIEA